MKVAYGKPNKSILISNASSAKWESATYCWFWRETTHIDEASTTHTSNFQPIACDRWPPYMSFCQTGRPVACAQCAFDPCYARATVVRARFLAAAFSDGSYLARVNDAYLRHVTFCIVRGPPLFIVSPISQRGPASVRGPLPTNSARLVQSPRRRRWRGWTNVQSNTTCVPYFSIM